MSTRWVRGDDAETWTTMDNTTIHDDLSCRALGLLLRFVSRPPGVEIDGIDGMVARAKHKGHDSMEGRAALQSAARELESAGYLVREQWQGSDGSWNTTITIYKQPQPPERRSDPTTRKRIAEVRKPTFGATSGDTENVQVIPKVGNRTPVTDLRKPASIPLSTLCKDSLDSGRCSSSVSAGARPSSDAADAANSTDSHDAAAAMEQDMLTLRSTVVEKEHTRAAVEGQQNQLSQFPPVEHRGPGQGVNGSAWAPAGTSDVPPVPKPPKKPAKTKRYDKPESISFPERFHLNTVMAERAKEKYPELHPDTEFAEFAAHARENDRKSANWMEAWNRWLARSERIRRDTLKNRTEGRGSFKSSPRSRQQPSAADYAKDLGYF